MRVDVTIVGGGVAGLSLAYFLSKKGIDCLVIEKNYEIGLKPCAGYIPRFLFKYFKIHGIQTSVDYMITISPSGKEYVRKVRGFIVDRRSFDRGIAIQASSYGAKLSLGEKALDFSDNILITNKRRISYKILVGCDGVNSIVARKLDNDIDKKLIAYAVQYEVYNLKDIDQNSTYNYFNVNYAPGSYVWVYPIGENAAKIGLGILPRVFKVNPFRLIEKFINENYKDSSIISVQKALIPLYAFRNKIVNKNVLLIGDSASSTDPISGAGISSAVMLAKVASEIIQKALENEDLEILQKYETIARKLIGRRLEHSLKKRYIANEFYKSNEHLEKNLKHIWIAFDEYWR